MPAICEHEFEREDPNNPGYSMTEYDLYAKLGMTLRKNLRFNEYELVSIKYNVAHHAFKTLQEAIAKANELEGTQNTWVECMPMSCPVARVFKRAKEQHKAVIENVSKIKD